MDALRADHLSHNGYHRTTSPVLDDLAAESLQFTNAYSVSSHTRESVPALLTGSYPDAAIDASYQLDSEPVAETLSAGGYATGGFHSNPFVSRAYGFDRGFDEFDDDLYVGQHKLIALAQRAVDKVLNRHYARAETINDRALSWLDTLDDGQPFFLWNHYMDTHGPYEPPREYRELYCDRDVSDSEAQSLYRRAVGDPDSITDEERELLIDLYDAEIRYNDDRIEDFLDALRGRGLLDRSLLIVTADHGEAFGERGYYEHPRHLPDELTRVPLLVRPPGGADGDVATPVSTLDVTATIERAVADDEVDRPSLLELPDENRSVFLQARGEGEHSNLRRYAVRTRREACFCERDRETGEVEFTEWTDRSLRDELAEHITERVHRRDDESLPSVGVEAKDPNDQIESRLTALGYND